MSDFQKYKQKRIKQNPEYWKNYNEEFEAFKIGEMLKLARTEAGLTQKEVAQKLNTTTSVIARIENHAKNIQISTLEKFAKAIGKNLKIELV